jgi:TPR repeat protein
MVARGDGVAQDEARAVGFYRRACDLGDLAGCTNLGQHLKSGKGIAKNEAEAFRLTKKSCDGRFPLACFNLGLLYRDGIGTAKDQDKANRSFEFACKAGLAAGCSRLGDEIAKSKTKEDLSRAVTLYRRACDRGDAKSCYTAGQMYREGVGVAADLQLSSEYMERACRAGYKPACQTGSK